MALEKSFRDVQVRSSDIGTRTIGLKELWQALKEGYDDFNAIGAGFGSRFPVISIAVDVSEN